MIQIHAKAICTTRGDHAVRSEPRGEVVPIAYKHCDNEECPIERAVERVVRVKVFHVDVEEGREVLVSLVDEEERDRSAHQVEQLQSSA